MRPRPCLLCGAENQETRVVVVRWRDPEPGREYSALPRCIDRVGCQKRVIGQLGTWEVIDATVELPELPQPAAATDVSPLPPDPFA